MAGVLRALALAQGQFVAKNVNLQLWQCDAASPLQAWDYGVVEPLAISARDGECGGHPCHWHVFERMRCSNSTHHCTPRTRWEDPIG